MRVTHGEVGAVHGNREVDFGALADTPVIDVAAGVIGRDGVDHLGFGRRHADGAKVRPDRDANIAQDIFILLDGGGVNRHAGVIYRRVHHTKRIGLRRPAVIVDRLGPVALAGGIHLIDSHYFAFLRLREHVAVMKSPRGGGVAAKGLAFE